MNTLCRTVIVCAMLANVVLAQEAGATKSLQNSLKMKFVFIPAGEFVMGSSPEEIARLTAEMTAAKVDPWYAQSPRSEGAQRRVTISRGFYVGVHEVTVGNFRAFVEGSGHRTTAEASGRGGYGLVEGQWRQSPRFTWKEVGYERGEDHPVMNVSWGDAVTFCEWLSKLEKRRYRLPTEAEWEYACRAGSPARYPWGDDAARRSEFAWIGENAGNRPRAVGTRKANAFGLHDMLGNVYEYCSDHFQATPFAADAVTDPVGPAKGTARVVRGASWGTSPQHARSAFRGDAGADHYNQRDGFRVVLEFNSKR
jgi:formylglycine-generating enzyme required for sulfatase activity